MGAWISLNQFKYFKKQIFGFVGIGSAPEFLERLMWKKFTKKMKEFFSYKLKYPTYVEGLNYIFNNTI
jgi:hypothetical protein